MIRPAALVPRNLPSPWALRFGVVVMTIGVGLAAAGLLLGHAPDVRGLPELRVGLVATGLILDALGVGIASAAIVRGRVGSGPRHEEPQQKLRVDYATVVGVQPRVQAPSCPKSEVGSLGVIDSARFTPTHAVSVLRLLLGLVLDAMKPATIGFMLPGIQAEYGLLPAQVAVLPVVALLGTTAGSMLFGYLGDAVGRRAAFMLTALLMAGTSVCGLMPALPWQVVTCFIMGLAAGGELPLIYAMLAETMPARHRGWLSVAVGGVGGLGGFLAAGSTAMVLEPAFSWRALFLPNLPTGLAMLVLLKWIPESPRYLMLHGFDREARIALRRIGVRDADDVASAGVYTRDRPRPGGFGAVLDRSLRRTTLTLSSYGFAWGLCNWGFVTWLPAMLRGLNLDAAAAGRLLSSSALFALPATAATAALFALWSSKSSAVLFGLATSLSLAWFGCMQLARADAPGLAQLSVAVLLVTSSSMGGVLAPYSVELYPTALRSIGGGVVAASAKLGGVVGPALVGILLTLSPGLLVPALVVSVPIALASVAMAVWAAETRGKRLEDLSQGVSLARGQVVPLGRGTPSGGRIE